jgi:polyphosphate kinase 2 (PPK2 family)
MSDTTWQLFPALSPEEQARRAGELINDPLLNTVMAEMDSTAVDTWRNSSSAMQREDMYRTVIAIVDLRKRLNERLESLKMLQHAQRQRSRPTN